MSSAFESLALAMKGPRHGASAGRAARLSGVIGAARRLVDERIDAAALAQSRGNPDSERVAQMFKALGVKKLFQDIRPAFNQVWQKPEASSFVEDKLDEIVRARHVVAHTAQALGISRASLAEWPSFLEALALVLDDRLERYVNNVLIQSRPL